MHSLRMYKSAVKCRLQFCVEIKHFTDFFEPDLSAILAKFFSHISLVKLR
jgi:hypothetical protein